MSCRILALTLLITVPTTPVCAGTWHSVQAASKLEFVAAYEGAEAPGEFGQFAISMTFDPDALVTSSLLVDVNVASASMNSTDIDEAILGPEWFNASAFPRAEFHSDAIRSLGDSNYAAEGLVSIKGKTRPLTVLFRWQAHQQSAEMSGSLVLSRTDFEIGTGEWAQDSPIGHEVEVRFKVALKAEQ